MPTNQINPFDYNIDKFDSGFLGPISDTDFRTYLFTHNLSSANPVIGGVISNPWQSLGSEYSVTESGFNVVDVPNLTDVAQTPSVYNNLTNPRQVNLSNNLGNINPQVQSVIGQTTPEDAGQGNDVTTLFNPNTSNVDVPGLQTVAQTPSFYNNLTNPRQVNLGQKIPDIDPSIQVIAGGTNPAEAGQGIDATTLFNPNTNNIDIPNLTDVAQNPSVYNNLTNPREVNLSKNLEDLNPEIQNILGQNTPQQAGLGVDATDNFNTNVSNLDLPSLSEVAEMPSPINNFTIPRYDNLEKNPSGIELQTWYPIEFSVVYNQWSGSYDTPYGVPETLKLGFAGNIEAWVNPGGIVNTTKEIRDDELFSRVNNKYGPSQMVAYSYNADEVVNSRTGLIQYNTGVQGDFRDQLLSRTLGVGVIPFSTFGSGINYKPDGQNISELDRIARKERGREVLNRIKLNFVDKTVGALNTSPFSLLAGGNLIQQNYTITVPKSKLGKAAQFAADLAGFNLPTSIIPDGAFGNYGVNRNDTDITNDILDYTGSGQKSLLYNALYINKYGPKLESSSNPPKTKLGQFIQEKLGAGQQPNTSNYLSETQSTKSEGPSNQPSTPTEMENPSVSQTIYGGFFGVNEYVGAGKKSSFSDEAGFDPTPGIPYDSDKSKNSTTQGSGGLDIYGANATTSEFFDWRVRQNGFKKGILKYTQDLVNKSAEGKQTYIIDSTTNQPKPVTEISPDKMVKSTTGFIGYFDSEVSFKGDPSEDGAHITGVERPELTPTLPSKGNQVRNIKLSKTDFTGLEGGDLYCRSWTSRRKYRKGTNLVRNGGNWWKIDPKFSQTSSISDVSGNKIVTVENGLKELMTMSYQGNGRPKIAWDSYDNKLWKDAHPDPSTLANTTKGLLIPYMFSIENLAWQDAPQKIALPPCELGPNGGRIMWFPPYNIDFSDNTSINWDSTSFIGRGESVYTYNHTERSGNLSWTIVVDHPEALHSIKQKFKEQLITGLVKDVDLDGLYSSFFAGCNIDSIKEMFETIIPKIPDPPQEKKRPKPKPVTPKDPPIKELNVYFENCRSASQTRYEGKYKSPDGIGRKIDFTYEVTLSAIGGSASNTPICPNSAPNPTIPGGKPGLNNGVQEKLEELAKFLVTEDGKNFKIKVQGYTSAANPTADFNSNLAADRANNTAEYLRNLILQAENGNPPSFMVDNLRLTYPKEDTMTLPKMTTSKAGTSDRWSIEQKGNESRPLRECSLDCVDTETLDEKGKPIKTCCDGDPCDPTLKSGQANSKKDKEDRYAKITLEYNPVFQQRLLDILYKKQQDSDAKKREEELKAYENTKKQLIDSVVTYYVNECDYFQKMENDDPFIYKSFTEKIKNFHPAFHAITPEGFNARLTFLQQCTRQGPQLLDPDQPQNMVFGRPPVCVLRIGDFYHTKIIIDSMNFTFDPLQWDLNPEGIGVQPMVVKVDMGFKFIGGSSLGGPIKQLQNAVSYNFFANTHVYNPARKLSDLADKRKTFIYGAFATPKQADDMYKPVEEEVKPTAEDESTTSTDDGQITPAPAPPSPTPPPEPPTPTPTPKPPTPPVKGNKLVDVIYQVNKQWCVETGQGCIPTDDFVIKNSTVTSTKNPTIYGIDLDVNIESGFAVNTLITNYFIKFTDNGQFSVWKIVTRKTDGKEIGKNVKLTGIYHDFRTEPTLDITFPTKTIKKSTYRDLYFELQNYVKTL